MQIYVDVLRFRCWKIFCVRVCVLHVSFIEQEATISNKFAAFISQCCYKNIPH